MNYSWWTSLWEGRSFTWGNNQEQPAMSHILISNIKILLKKKKKTAQYIGNVLEGQKHQETRLQWSRKTVRERQEKKGKTKHHSRRIKKTKKLKLKNGLFASIKASGIQFPPYTPHQTMWHNPPYIYIAMSPKIAWPRIQQIHYPLRHHPTNTKQAKEHTPHLICYRTAKEKMIYRFPTPFAHITPLKYNNMPLLKIICS